jgi:hypothetical protein
VALSLSERNERGWLVSEGESKLTSAILGEPDKRLFEIPTDYQVEHSSEEWPYVWLNEFHGNDISTAFSTPTM